MNTNRLGIFAFYEKNGMVEDYVVYLLKELRGSVNRLIFVCNGVLSDRGRRQVKGLVDDITIRENRGYDAGAFREVLLGLMECGQLNGFDEIVLCNDTFFGPFIPLADIFVEMDGRKLDFWGLSSQPKSVDFWTGSDDIVPAFIHSFFLVINRKMFADPLFASFWRGLAVDKWNLTQVVKNYEQKFTPYFESMGYRWGTYTDNSFFEGAPEENVFTPYLMMPYELIRYGKCPFLKKKCITGKDIVQWREPDNGSFGKAMKYVGEYTEYDTNMIREYMIKNCTKQVIADKLKLSCVVSEQRKAVDFDYSRVAIVVNMNDKRQRSLVATYLDQLSDQINVYYVEGSIGKNIGDKLPRKVEFVCVLQDDLREGIEGECDRSAYSLITRCEKICDNLIYSDGYIISVVRLFEQDNYLGMLCIQDMNEKCALNVHLDKLTSGWIRRCILERDTFYYTGTIRLKHNAEITLSNAKADRGSITLECRRKLFDFCSKQVKVYLYGTGGVATRTAYALQKKGIRLDGFIVSDGQPIERELMGYKVYFVSEIDLDNAGIVVSVEERLHKVIAQALEDKGMKNYIYSCY